MRSNLVKRTKRLLLRPEREPRKKAFSTYHFTENREWNGIEKIEIALMVIDVIITLLLSLSPLTTSDYEEVLIYLKRN